MEIRQPVGTPVRCREGRCTILPKAAESLSRSGYFLERST